MCSYPVGFKSLTKSPVPGNSINGKFIHGPVSSLKSEPSEALEDFLEDALLDDVVPRL